MIDPVPHLAGLALRAGGALGAAAEQDHLFQARQMQAPSLGWHIVIVCFGVAFPAIVLSVEALGLRTGDPVYRTLARRWSKAMLVLFAVGVVSGTILSFELGILWPEFMARFGEVFGLGFALEGFSFFAEAIFIAIYVYGWDRLPPVAHFLTGIPVAVAGVTGSLFVLAVNGWMNAPRGSGWRTAASSTWIRGRPSSGATYGTSWCTCSSRPTWSAASAWPASTRGRGCVAGATATTASSWWCRHDRRARGARAAGGGRLGRPPPCTCSGWYAHAEVRDGERPRLLSLLAEHDPGTTVEGLDAVAPDERPPVNVVRVTFQLMVAIGTALAALAAWYRLAWWRHRRLPRSRWFHRAVVLSGPAAVVALICGWTTTEVGRQPWIVYRVMRVEEAVTGASGSRSATRDRDVAGAEALPREGGRS